MNVRLWILPGVVSSVVIGLASCGPPAINGGFDSGNPAAKMYAIEYAARDGDRNAIRKIVEQLDSDDPAVRLLAISALKRLTGKTYGYCDLDPPLVRREAIARWVQAIDSGEAAVLPATALQSPSTSTLDSETPRQGMTDHHEVKEDAANHG